MTLAWLLAGSLALAPPTPSPRVVVSLPDLPDDEADERVAAAVLAHTRARGLQIEVIRPERVPSPAQLAAEGHALAERWQARGVLWIDLGPDGMLYLSEADRAEVYGRKLPAVGGASTAQAESIANVVSAMVAAILDDQRPVGQALAGLEVVDPELDRIEPPTPEPEVTPVQPPPSDRPRVSTTTTAPAWPRLRLALGFIGGTFAAAAPWQSGFGLAIGWRPAPRIHADLGYEVIPRASIRTEVMVLGVDRHPLTLSAGYTRELGRRWDLRFTGRVMVDVVRRTVESELAGVTLTGDRTRVFPGVAATVGAGVHPTRSVRLGLTVGVEMVLSRSDYVLYNPERVVVLAPSMTRFVMAAGLEFELVRRRRGGTNIDPVERRPATARAHDEHHAPPARLDRARISRAAAR